MSLMLIYYCMAIETFLKYVNYGKLSLTEIRKLKEHSEMYIK